MASGSLRYSLSPMQQVVKTETSGHRLTLNEVLDWLVEDKLVAAAPAEELKKERRYYRGASHPLVSIAEQKWRHATAPGKALSIELLTEWLAKPGGLEQPHINPLNIHLAGAANTNSSTSTTRFRILPVGASGKETTVATAPPNVRRW